MDNKTLKHLISTIREDIKINKGNSKGKTIIILFRIAAYIRSNKSIIIKTSGWPIAKFYDWLVIWIMGIELPATTKIGSKLQLWHGTGLVINDQSILGDNVLLRHNTTIGNKYLGSGCPVIGNNVEIGAHSVLIGSIKVGDNVTIGAGTVVTKSIPSDSIAYGNPLEIKPKKVCPK